MKIESPDHAPAISKSQQLSNVSKGAEKSFEHLLVAPGPAQKRLAAGVVAPRSEGQLRSNVFSFEELGVFGRYGAQQHQDPSELARENNPRCAAPLDELGKFGEPVVSMTADIRSMAVADGRSALGPEVSSSSIKIAPTMTAAARADVAPAVSASKGDAFHGDPIESTSVENLAPSGDTGPEKLREDRSRASPVSVSVSGEDYALNIIARSASEQDDSSELRRLMEDAAAEFGLQIHEVHLNGSASQSFKAFLGGSNGSRIR